MSYEVVRQTAKGKATWRWKKKDGSIMYLIEFVDGKTLWTNSVQIIEDELRDES